ncbi:hypothetical protein LTR56_025382 [Elasticomyces elasticus]|nr:hypothetical protein LTR56_025382 [Elasticomyces elasticus]KAK3656157.1 hypothetical protein LTR22_009864 [Elasticomyces elasticus]KAK5714459.1 hypothetical protein LTR15_010641 [Elasticomyces elasticus]
MLASTLALVALTTANPIGEMSPNIIARDNSKLNQYNHPDCKDDNGSNVPTYHAAPPMYKCYNIDSTTESFFWNLGPLTYFWGYNSTDCTSDDFLPIEGYEQSGCQTVYETFAGDDYRILSVMMH